MDLTEFLAARLDEDEAAAKAAVADTCAEWHHTPAVTATGPIILIAGGVADEIEVADAWAGQDAAAHIARHDPARVLREVAAKRAIVNEWRAVQNLIELTGSKPDAYRNWVLRHLATAWSDHPDYQQEWKPWTSASA